MKLDYKYRVELYTSGCYFGCSKWDPKLNGNPNDINLAIYIDSYINSLNPGGLNENIKQRFPETQILGGRIVDQRNNREIVEILL